MGLLLRVVFVLHAGDYVILAAFIAYIDPFATQNTKIDASHVRILLDSVLAELACPCDCRGDSARWIDPPLIRCGNRDAWPMIGKEGCFELTED
jgi:hypothetical protein